MRRLLKAYFTVLGRNKRVLALVTGLQIVSCLILTVLTAFFITVATVNIGSATAGYYEGIAMADVKQRVAAVLQSAEVADICCYTENNYDFRYGEAVSASGTVYDFTDENAGDIIIMPKALVGEFEVGDEVEIGGKTFTVAAFGLYGRAQVPFFSAPDAALTNSIEINPANGTAASKALFASMQTEFADASYLNIPPVRNTFTMIAEMPLALVAVVAINLLNLAALMMCYKYFSEHINKINGLLLTLGVKPSALVLTLACAFAVFALCAFALGAGLYYLVEAYSVPAIYDGLGIAVYRMGAGDIALIFVEYIAVTFALSALYLRRRNKKDLRVQV